MKVKEQTETFVSLGGRPNADNQDNVCQEILCLQGHIEIERKLTFRDFSEMVNRDRCVCVYVCVRVRQASAQTDRKINRQTDRQTGVLTVYFLRIRTRAGVSL